MRKSLRSLAWLSLFVAGSAIAAPPVNGVPSAAAKSKARFSTRFYTMVWNAPDRLDYRYENGELSLRVQQLGRGHERAELELRVRAAKPGRYALPSSGAASFHVLGCDQRVGGASHVTLTRLDAERIEGSFELQGHCTSMASNSETLRNGRFSLVFDPVAARR